MLHLLSNVELIIDVLYQLYNCLIALLVIRTLLNLYFVFRRTQEMNLICLKLRKGPC